MPRVQYKRLPVTDDQKRKKTEEMLKRIFMKHDYDGNKMLSKDEIKAAFRELGSRFPGFRADRAMSYADADGDKQIDQQEMSAMINYATSRGFKVA